MASSPIVIKAEPIVVRISPLGFHQYASEFLHAARSVGVGSSFSPVPYYLYCRSLELVLKAFLLTKNVSAQELKNRKNLGHDLVKALDKAKTLGLGQLLTVTSVHENELVKANNYYASKGFEYFEVIKAIHGYPDLPEISILSEFASHLIAALEPVCLNAT